MESINDHFEDFEELQVPQCFVFIIQTFLRVLQTISKVSAFSTKVENAEMKGKSYTNIFTCF